MYKPLLLTFAAFCLFSCLVLTRKKGLVNAAFILILVLLSYDLISFGRNYNTTVTPESIFPKTPSIEFLLKQRGPFRVVQDKGFFVNGLMPFGLEELGGYANVYPDRVNKLMSYIVNGDMVFAGAIFDRWVTFNGRTADFSSRIFDLLNVRYILTQPSGVIPYDKYRLVYWEDIAIYENKQVMPRAYVVHKYRLEHDLSGVLRYMWSSEFDMRNELILEEEPSAGFKAGIRQPSFEPQATIETYTPDKVVINTDLSTNGWLVLSDTYYPGWKAEVDGIETPIYRANCNFRAVELHAGKHSVSFSFDPPSARAGMMLSFAGAIFAAAGLVVFRKQPTRKKAV